MAVTEEDPCHNPHFLLVSLHYIYIMEETKQNQKTFEMHQSSRFIRFSETCFCDCQDPLLVLQPQSITLHDNLLHVTTVIMG